MLLKVSAVVAILGAIYFYWIQNHDRDDPSVQLKDSYDYIIIGAGSAGCVVANRLSEDPTKTVLLLEAGSSELSNPKIDIPLAATEIQLTEHDWAFKTVPQKNACLAMVNQECAWPKGKVLGGTSNLNYMHYMRGSRFDYDSWDKEGCKGWSYKDVLPYFIKSEDIRIKDLQKSAYHGKDGYLSVSDGIATPLNPLYSKAVQELGYTHVDCNGKSQIGYCSGQETVKKGVRWSTVKAFLRPVMHRPNLHVSSSSHVTKIIIEEKKAVGAVFIRNGRKHVVRANQEVVLSGGAVSSPQILLLSGIGPKEHLKSLGIPLEADLSVGENLHDHLMMTMRFFDKTLNSVTAKKATSVSSLLQYMIFKSGYMYLSKMSLEGSAFFTDGEKKPPYTQIHFLTATGEASRVPLTARTLNLKDTIAEGLLNDAKNMAKKEVESYYLLPILLHPKSKGTIKLQSTDPFDPPLIDPKYLSHPEDIKTFLRAIRMALAISNTTALRAIGSAPEDALEVGMPVCNDLPYHSDDYWICRIRQFTYTVYHPTSTCRMGAENDPTAVVDYQLRVRGIQNLRVVDASVMRNIPSGNTNAPTIMVAEKASDLIRGIDSVQSLRKVTNSL